MDVEVLEEIETLSPSGKKITVQKVRDRIEGESRANEHENVEVRTYYRVNEGGTLGEVIYEDGVFKRKVKEGLQEKVELLRPLAK